MGGADVQLHSFLNLALDGSERENIRTRRLGYDIIYLTAVELTPGGSGTVNIYTQTIHRTTH
jgi:hypothetical protein